MSKVEGLFNILNDGSLLFYCPGCNESHQIWVNGEAQCKWRWNCSYDKPTFTPSLLIRSGHYASNRTPQDCWCTYNDKLKSEGKEESEFKCRVCHSFITDGKIQFLSDCSHELAGTTVDIPEWRRSFG